MNLRVVHHFTPIGRLEHGIQVRKRLVFKRAAANRAHVQRKAELIFNQCGVFCENGQRARADVPESNDPYVNSVHMPNTSLYDEMELDLQW